LEHGGAAASICIDHIQPYVLFIAEKHGVTRRKTGTNSPQTGAGHGQGHNAGFTNHPCLNRLTAFQSRRCEPWNQLDYETAYAYAECTGDRGKAPSELSL